VKTPKASSVRKEAVAAALSSEFDLQKAAVAYSKAFNEGVCWGSSEARLNYTIAVWRDLAFAALAFAEAHPELLESQ
jgi:hypothetical protein